MTDVLEWVLPICRLCLDGRGGECHTPGCTFWVCPAPDEEQAQHIRNHGREARLAPDPRPTPCEVCDSGLRSHQHAETHHA